MVSLRGLKGIQMSSAGDKAWKPPLVWGLKYLGMEFAFEL
jgi:hypothetical protein